MALRGTKPIPLQILQGRGTATKHRHGEEKDLPQIEPRIPKPPQGVLGAVGRAEWKRITKILANARVLTEADRTVLTQYCLLYEEMVKQGQDFQAAKHTQLRLCQVELGLTPSARMRLREK